MRAALVLAPLLALTALAGTALFVRRDVVAGAKRLQDPSTKDQPAAAVAIADDAEASYCTPQFKGVLQRVLHACGLSGSDSRRGCQPADVKTFASISDADFNELFTPLAKRGGILMFDDNVDKLDDGAKKLLLEKWAERKGARYFFVVARASKKGGVELNRALSHRRANSVMFLLQEQDKDANLEKQVGQLWLGSEFAQLPKAFCDGWQNSRPGKPCNDEAINRSAFVSWVDCRL